MKAIICLALGVLVVAQTAAAINQNLFFSRADQALEKQTAENRQEVKRISLDFENRIRKFNKTVHDISTSMRQRAASFFNSANHHFQNANVTRALNETEKKYESFIDNTKEVLESVPADLALHLAEYLASLNNTISESSHLIIKFSDEFKTKAMHAFLTNRTAALACTCKFSNRVPNFLKSNSVHVRKCADNEKNKINGGIVAYSKLLSNIISYERNVLKNYNRCIDAGQNRHLTATRITTDCISIIGRSLDKNLATIRDRVNLIKSQAKSEIRDSIENFELCSALNSNEDISNFAELRSDIDKCLTTSQKARK